MLVFATFGKSSVVCYEKGKVLKVSRRDILDRKVKVDNLQVINGKLSGKRFDIYQLPEIKTEINKVMIVKVKLTSDGKDIIGYYYIDALGKMKFTNKDDLRTFRKLSVLNGSIDKGMMVVSNIEVLETEKMYKPISYAVDDYYDMFNMYKNNGMIVNDYKKVSSTTEAFGRQQEYTANSFENFMNHHKQMYDLILKSEVLRVVKICENSVINGEAIEEVENSVFFYVVTFKYLGNTKSVIIHSKDKRMIRLINSKGTRLSRTSLNDIKNLIIDKESSSSTVSARSLVEKIDLEDSIANIDEDLRNTVNIEIKNGIVKLVTGDFKIRRNILIGSSDFRLMWAA